MKSDNFLFNGLGTSHVDEILYGAVVPPWLNARSVLSTADIRSRLLESVRIFFEAAQSYKYQIQQQSAGTSSLFAFDRPHSQIQAFIHFIQVYRQGSFLCNKDMLELIEKQQFEVTIIPPERAGNQSDEGRQAHHSWILDLNTSSAFRVKVWGCKIGKKTAYTIFHPRVSTDISYSVFDISHKQLSRTSEVPEVGPTSFYYFIKFKEWLDKEIQQLPPKGKGRPKKLIGRDALTRGFARKTSENALRVEKLLAIIPDALKQEWETVDKKHKMKDGKRVN